jgi:hypothetical protein
MHTDETRRVDAVGSNQHRMELNDGRFDHGYETIYINVLIHFGQAHNLSAFSKSSTTERGFLFRNVFERARCVLFLHI